MAARIAGVTLPNKKIEIALTYIYGIGLVRSQGILSALKIDGTVKANDLTNDDVGKLRTYIEKEYRVEGDLRREISSNVKRLKEIGANRGIRHILSLPVRGQRTKTNSRTVRGNKRTTMGSGKNKLDKK